MPTPPQNGKVAILKFSETHMNFVTYCVAVKVLWSKDDSSGHAASKRPCR